jgi:hypothetical protein
MTKQNKKPKVRVSWDLRTLSVDGQQYMPSKTTYKDINGVKHLDQMIFKPITEKEAAKILKQRTHIINRLAGAVTPERVIKESVDNMSLSEITTLYNLLQTKGVKVTPEDGCLGIEIDAGKHKKRHIQIMT